MGIKTKQQIKNIENIVKKLHEINFNNDDGVIHINHDNYSFKDYIKTQYYHQNITGYCNKCQQPAVNSTECNLSDCQLRNISHGAHTLDFLCACNMDYKTMFNNEWNDTPVLFLMENPSINYGSNLYKKIDDDKTQHPKCPTQKWYWIHNNLENIYNQKEFDDDTFLVKQQYGNMIFSLINQYKLANAYLTNIIKCGISGYYTTSQNSLKEKALNLDYYKDECKKNCLENILKKEILSLCSNSDEIIIFAFGKRTYYLIKDFFENQTIQNEQKVEIKYNIALLPHPSDFHINNNFRKYILKGVLDETFGNINKINFVPTNQT